MIIGIIVLTSITITTAITIIILIAVISVSPSTRLPSSVPRTGTAMVGVLIWKSAAENRIGDLSGAQKPMPCPILQR